MRGREKEKRLSPQGMVTRFKQFWCLWGLDGKIPVLWMKTLTSDWECGTLVTDVLFSISMKWEPFTVLKIWAKGSKPIVIGSLTIKTPGKFYFMSSACSMSCKPMKNCTNQEHGMFPGIPVPSWPETKCSDAEWGVSVLVLSECVYHSSSSHARPALWKLPQTQNRKSGSKEEGYN